jgi:hypothetical protein
MRRRLAVDVVLLLSLAACAPATSTTARDPNSYQVLQHDASVLGEREIADAQVVNVYDAVTRLRPQFIKHRGPTSINLSGQSQMNVYLDDMRLGGLDIMRSTSVGGIRSIRYVNASEATFRWGVNNSGGAILLSTRN